MLPTVKERLALWPGPPPVDVAVAHDPVLAAHLEQCVSGPVGDADAALAPWLTKLAAASSVASLVSLSGQLEAAGLPGLFRLEHSVDGPVLMPSRLVVLTDVGGDGQPMPRGGWRGVDLHVKLASSALAEPLDPEVVRTGLMFTTRTGALGAPMPLAEAEAASPVLAGWSKARGLLEDREVWVSPDALALVEGADEVLTPLREALRFALWTSFRGLGDEDLSLQSATLAMIWTQGVGLNDIYTSEVRCAALLRDRIAVSGAHAIIEQSGLPLRDVTEQVRGLQLAGLREDRDVLGEDPARAQLRAVMRKRLEGTQLFVGPPAGIVPLPALEATRVASHLARLHALADDRLAQGHRDGPGVMFPSCTADLRRSDIYCGLPALLPLGPSTDGTAPEVTALLSEMVAHEWTHLLDFQLNGGAPVERGASTEATRNLMARSACLAADPAQSMGPDGQPAGALQQVWSEAHADHLGQRLGLEAWYSLGHTDARVFFAAVASSSCDAPAQPGGAYLPNELRVNRAAAVNDAFRTAFDCPATAPLAQEPTCDLW